MSFQDLPQNWSEQSLSDPTLAADVIDLFINVGDRRLGILTALLCDEQDRLVVPVQVELPGRIEEVRPSACGTVLKPIISPLQVNPGGGLLLGLGRPGPAKWPAIDNEWAEAAVHVCRAAGVRLIGFYIATLHEVHPAQLPAAA